MSDLRSHEKIWAQKFRRLFAPTKSLFDGHYQFEVFNRDVPDFEPECKIKKQLFRDNPSELETIREDSSGSALIRENSF